MDEEASFVELVCRKSSVGIPLVRKTRKHYAILRKRRGKAGSSVRFVIPPCRYEKNQPIRIRRHGLRGLNTTDNSAKECDNSAETAYLNPLPPL